MLTGNIVVTFDPCTVWLCSGDSGWSPGTITVGAVATAAQDTARGVGSSSDAVHELNRMATSLKELVGEFRY